MTTNKARKGIFISYSRKDEEYLKRVKVHLSALGKGIEESVWDDSKLKPGEEWEKTIKEKINSAEIAIFLVSADFLASEFIRYKELPLLLEAAKRDTVTLISIILKPCNFEKSLLFPYQTINTPSQPLQNEKDAYHEETYNKLASYIDNIDNTITLSEIQNLEEKEEMTPPDYTLTEQQSLLNIRVVLLNYILLRILKFHNPAANKIVKSFTNGI